MNIVGRQNRIQAKALDADVINRIKTSVLSICECENPNNVIATAIVWDYTNDNEVLILTNYHTWNDEEYSYCLPPTHSAVPPKKSNIPTTMTSNKKITKKTNKRKKDESEDKNMQDPIQLILRNDVGLNYQFTLTSDLFYRCSPDEDFAILKLPSDHFNMPRILITLETHATQCIHAFGYIGHTNVFAITAGEITGYIPLCFTMNLLSAPGYSGAAILADGYGRAVGYMGRNLNASKEKNSQHHSCAYKFDRIIRVTNRQIH